MISDVKNKSMVPAQTVSVESTVSCALRDLGYKQDGLAITCGTLKHDLTAALAIWAFNNLPLSVSTGEGFNWYDSDDKKNN